MAVDEVQRLVIQVENENKIRELVQLLAQQQAAMARVIEQQKQGAIGLHQYEAAMSQSAATMIQYNAQIKSLQASSGTTAGGRQQAMMAAGYGIQDALTQQSLGGMINAASNNIPGIAMGMGAGPQAMMATMIGTAVAQALAMAMPSILRAMSGKTEQEEKDAAAKEKADKAAMLEAQKAGAAPTAAEATYAGQVGGRIKALGGGMRANVRAAIAPGLRVSEQEVEAYARKHAAPGQQGRLTKLDMDAARNTLLNQQAEERTSALMDAAASGDPGAAQAIQDLAAGNPELQPLADAVSGFGGPGDPGVGPGRAEAEQQMMLDAARGGGPAPLASRVFGRGVAGAKSPAQQAREQEAAAGAEARKRYRAGMGGGGQTAQTEQNQALRDLQALDRQMAELADSFQYQAEVGSGVNGSAVQLMERMVQRLQEIAGQSGSDPILRNRLNVLMGGASMNGQYSASPLANW